MAGAWRSGTWKGQIVAGRLRRGEAAAWRQDLPINPAGEKREGRKIEGEEKE